MAADHGGFALKQMLSDTLREQGYHVLDLGTDSAEAVDYPRFGDALARAVIDGRARRGVLMCGTGIGVGIAANRHIGIRAALCHNTETARLARAHNNANVLVLGGRTLNPGTALGCLETFLNTPFEGGRHARRVAGLDRPSLPSNTSSHLSAADPEIFEALTGELHRQRDQIELIASENLVSEAVLEAQASVLTNKYAEGYPGRRYYGGCGFADRVEELAVERTKSLFSCRFANVQPHSGSQANQAVMLALLKPGDTVLGMSLAAGGHLTHGARPNLSGKWFKSAQYGVRRQDGLIDYDEVAALVDTHRPKLVIAGGSAYSRIIDFARFRAIADRVGAWFMVDMAHFAGLVAAGAYPSPFPHAHVVTSTTHKTLRGPRGGMILSNEESLSKKIDSALFPGLQGGPLMHVIAAKAVALREADTPEFRAYAHALVDNARALGDALAVRGLDAVTGGTDTHLLLIDLRRKGLTGDRVEAALERAGLTCNKNAIPFDPRPPTVTSGIRLGTPVGTARGFNTELFAEIGGLIADVVDSLADSDEGENHAVETVVREQVSALCRRFPVYSGLTPN